MAPVVESVNTQTATIGTEHTLLTPTTAKTRVLTVNLRNMTGSDRVEIRVYNKTLSTDSILTSTNTHLVYLATFAGVISDPVVQTVPIPVAYGCLFSLKQTAGTGRAFDWHVVTLD